MQRAGRTLERAQPDEASETVFARIRTAAGNAVQSFEQAAPDLPEKARDVVEAVTARLAQETRNLWDQLARRAGEPDSKGGTTENSGRGPSQGQGQGPSRPR